MSRNRRQQRKRSTRARELVAYFKKCFVGAVPLATMIYWFRRNHAVK